MTASDYLVVERLEAKVEELRTEIERLEADLQIMTDSYSEISRIVGRQGNEAHSLADDVRTLRAQIERLTQQNADLRRWQALGKPLTAAMSIVVTDMQELRADNKLLRAVIVRAKDALLDGQSTQWVHDLLVAPLLEPKP